MPIKAPKYSYAVIGQWNVRCDRCGAKAKASELVFDSYYGLWVHPWEFDGMHPIDRHEAKPDDIPPPYSQPLPATRFDDTAVLQEGDSKSSNAKYDVGILEATYVANGGGDIPVKTGAFDDQDTYGGNPVSPRAT